MTTSWDSLLDLLASTPRENGTAALAETAVALTTLLKRLGIPNELIAYVAHPYRLRLAGALALLAALYGVFLFVALTGGAFASTRSPGALDNGAATAVMVRLGERLITSPPARTKVSLLFLSGEEIGVQGSWVCAQERFATPPAVKTAVINLEFLGAATDFGVFKGERFTTRSYDPDARLVEVFDGVHRAHHGKPLWVTWYSAATDARSFMAHGVPAMTLLNALPGHALPRGMHAPGDDRSRIVPGGLDAALAILETAIRRLDADGL